MTKVRFLADFDYKPKRSVTLAFKAGEERVVPTACAEIAISKQKAVAIDEAQPAGINETIARQPRRRKVPRA